MKITIKNKIPVHEGFAYIHMTKETPRPDIQNYLNGRRPTDEYICENIDRYLQKLNVYDRYKSITEIGEKVIRKGVYPQAFQGKYHIGYVNEENGYKIIFYKREKSDYNKNIRTENISFRKTHTAIDNDIKEPTEIQLENTSLDFESRNEKAKDVDFINIIKCDDRGEEITRKYIGRNVDNENINISYTRHKINDEDRFQILKVSRKLNGEWIDQYKRVALYNIDNLDDNELKNFIIPYKRFEEDDKSITVENIDIMPRDEEQAKRWIEKLLEIEARKEYLQQGDIDRIINNYREREIICDDWRLPDIEAEDFAEKSKDKNVYWHLYAPLDLNPIEFQKKYNKDILTIEKGKIYSFSEILEKIGVSKAKWVGYYDRYISNIWQQKFAEKFLSSIDTSCRLAITLRDAVQNYKEKTYSYISKHYHEKGIEVEYIEEVFGDKGFHDRYLVICDLNEKISVWAMTTGITGFNKINESKQSSARYQARETMTIAPISTREAPLDLVNYIKKKFNGR
jgi:hypothetical protein